MANVEVIREGLQARCERGCVATSLLRPQLGALGPSCIDRLVGNPFLTHDFEYRVFAATTIPPMVKKMAVTTIVNRNRSREIE